MKEGWEIKKIGTVCKVIAGQSPEGKYYNNIGNGMPFYQGKKEYGLKYIGEPTTWTTKITKEAEEGDILMSVRAPVGPINFSTQKICIGRGLAAIRATKLIEKEFLYNFLVKHENEIIGNTGAVFNSINKAQIEAIEIPLPTLPEQQRIVTIIDEAFAAIATAKTNAEQNLKNAKELFESYLQNIFENKGEEWDEKTLGEIGKPLMCKRIMKHQTSTTGEIPFYKIGTFGKIPDAFISKEIYNEFRTKYSFPKKGDILISASGTIGRRVRYDGEPAFFQDSNIVWIDNDEKQVLNDFLYVFYEFCDWQPSKGATISRLYNSNLTSIKIVFPKLLVEQKKILKKIDAVSTETKKLEAIYQQKIADLEELKKSVLQKAFNGEL
ncbi:MAG: restriction endonuclease subunit S [Bacteroidetes bacterium]|nr:restriction endonuclease subunit S [Bacteroidota bacterium]